MAQQQQDHQASNENDDGRYDSNSGSEGDGGSTVFCSTSGGSYDEFRFVELEEIKVCGDNQIKDCRICHLSLEESPEMTIELGCSCKDDLAVAHQSCARHWFSIKGDKTCEICNSVACNVIVQNEMSELGQQQQQQQAESNAATPLPTATEMRSCWQGHRVLNFLLGCMVFAFVASWFFHFNESP